jgi:hypothetical protein
MSTERLKIRQANNNYLENLGGLRLYFKKQETQSILLLRREEDKYAQFKSQLIIPSKTPGVYEKGQYIFTNLKAASDFYQHVNAVSIQRPRSFYNTNPLRDLYYKQRTDDGCFVYKELKSLISNLMDYDNELILNKKIYVEPIISQRTNYTVTIGDKKDFPTDIAIKDLRFVLTVQPKLECEFLSNEEALELTREVFREYEQLLICSL